MFYPPNAFKDIYWDLIQSLCLLVTCILTPFNLAFTDQLQLITWYVWFNNSIDIIFAIDILFNFNAAYVDEEFQMIDDRIMIAKEYCKSWFLIDILSILPFDFILELVTSS
jgi:hypothetical protein